MIIMSKENVKPDNNLIIWARLQPGYNIINLTEPYYEQVFNLIKNHYFSSDFITNTTRMSEDETSTAKFFERVLSLVKNNQSIILVEEKSLKVFAVLILSTVTKVDFGKVHSKENLSNGEAYNKYIELKTALNKKADIYIDFDCDVFMRFYLMCIHGDYLTTNYGYYLLRCGIDVCKSLHVPIACGIFPNEEFQKCAGLVGFQVAHKINYSDWMNKINFDEVGDVGDCGCCLMVAKVPAPDVVPPKMPEAETDDKKGKEKDKKGKKK